MGKNEYFGGLINSTPPVVLALYAEIQVAGLAEPVATFTCWAEQHIDHTGRPSSDVRYRPLRLTLVGMAAMAGFFTEWAADSYLQRSGWLVIYEGDQVRWRLAFFDAWCVLYRSNFRPGVPKRAAYELELELSARFWEWNGVEIEHNSALWWEKDHQVRKRALTPPTPILPGPGARNQPAEQLPTPSQNPLPSPALSAITGTPQAPKPPVTALEPTKKPLYGPTISKWYKKGGFIEVLPSGNWKYTDWEHNSVEYEGDEPNFDKYARQQVDIDDMQGDCETDFTKANNNAPLGPILDGNTWHHKQNMRTMQEVDFTIHRRFTHYGARHLLKQQTSSTLIQSNSAPITKRVFRKR